jgi:bloom syndrome protein
VPGNTSHHIRHHAPTSNVHAHERVISRCGPRARQCDALMPQNNLREHLNWLLSEKPFVPPAISLVAYDPDAPGSSGTLSQPLSFLAESASNNVCEPAIARPTTPPIPPPIRAEPRSVDIQRRVSEAGTAAEMARLRTTPGNGRPRLVLAGVPPHTTPSALASTLAGVRRSASDLYATGT